MLCYSGEYYTTKNKITIFCVFCLRDFGMGPVCSDILILTLFGWLGPGSKPHEGIFGKLGKCSNYL